jgi:hypothetical protein
MLDFSAFKNVDLKDPNNIIFFSVAIILIALFLFVVYYILSEMFKFLMKVFKKRFGKDNVKVVVKQLEESKMEREAVEAQRKVLHAIGMDAPPIKSAENVNAKDKKAPAKDANARIEITKAQKPGEPAQQFQSQVQAQAQGQSQAQPGAAIQIPTSKKPVEAVQQIPGVMGAIQIPTSKKPGEVAQQIPGVAGGVQIPVSKETREKAQKLGQQISAAKAKISEGAQTKSENSPQVNIGKTSSGATIGVSKEKIEEGNKAPLIGSEKKDESIFGGKEEISRIQLREKLRSDPGVWRKEVSNDLPLSTVERVALEKNLLSQSYGQNISKSDLKSATKKLSQKLLDVKNPQQHEKVRKEIKFLKDIGGIK